MHTPQQTMVRNFSQNCKIKKEAATNRVSRLPKLLAPENTDAEDLSKYLYKKNFETINREAGVGDQKKVVLQKFKR